MLARLSWLAVALVLTSCASTPAWKNSLPLPSNTDEANNRAISKLMDDVQQGVENKSIYKVLAHVAKDYNDGTRNTHAAARDALKEFFGSWRSVHLTRTNPRMVFTDAGAEVLESIGLIAEPLNLEGSPLNWFGDVRIWLRREDSGEWKIIRVAPVS